MLMIGFVNVKGRVIFLHTFAFYAFYYIDYIDYIDAFYHIDNQVKSTKNVFIVLIFKLARFVHPP